MRLLQKLLRPRISGCGPPFLPGDWSLQQSKPPLNFQRSHFRSPLSLLQRPTLTIFVSQKSSRCLRRYESHPHTAFSTFRTGRHGSLKGLMPQTDRACFYALISALSRSAPPGPPTPVSLDKYPAAQMLTCHSSNRERTMAATRRAAAT